MYFIRVIENYLSVAALIESQYLIMQLLVLVARFVLPVEQGVRRWRVFYFALIECVQLIEFLRVLGVTTIVTVLISACKPVSGF